MKGVCCGCQRLVEVELVYRNIMEYVDYDDEEPSTTVVITSRHDACGEPCMGSLLEPQAIVYD